MTTREMVGKKISEVVKDLDCNIKLGCDNGSGFLYCGNPSETKIDFKELDNISDGRIQGKIKMRENRLEDQFSRCPTVERYMRTYYSQHEPKVGTVEGYLKTVQLHMKRTQTSATKLNDIKKWNLNKPKMKDRIIKDIYCSVDSREPDGTLVVLIDGYESGDFWTTKEAIEGVKRSIIDDDDDFEVEEDM